MSIITKHVEFEAAHRVLEAVSERCKQGPHGHSYKVEFSIEGDTHPVNGMIADFGDLKGIKRLIDEFDHAFVLWANEEDEIKDFYLKHFKRIIIMKKNCTAENMARYFMRELQIYLDKEHYDKNLKAHSVRLWETRTGSTTMTTFDDDDIAELHHQDGLPYDTFTASY